MWKQLSCKKSLLVICKILRLFVNTLSAVDKYSVLNRDNLIQPIQMQLSQKHKTFFGFFSAFLKSCLNFQHFKKRMTLIPDLFLRLRTQKNVVRLMSKELRFRRPFEKQDAKRAQILLKFQRQQLYHIYWSLSMQFSCKNSLLVICQIFTLFLDTFNDDDKYSLLNKENLTQLIQMQLCQKEKSFSWFFSQHLKSSLKV